MVPDGLNPVGQETHILEFRHWLHPALQGSHAAEVALYLCPRGHAVASAIQAPPDIENPWLQKHVWKNGKKLELAGQVMQTPFTKYWLVGHFKTQVPLTR